MDEELNIKSEYERLHGHVSRKMLFEEEEYESLRRQILLEPKASLGKYFMGSVFSGDNVQYLRKKMMLNPLPFKDIELVPERVWVLQERIRVAKNAGHHLYYIKKEENGQLVSFAAGYYDRLLSGEFMVMEHSFFSEDLRKSYSTEIDFWRFLKYERKEGFCFEKTNHKYESASKAAKCYLGDKASINDWIDDNGMSLAKDKAYREFVPEPPQKLKSQQHKLDLSLSSDIEKKTQKRVLRL